MNQTTPSQSTSPSTHSSPAMALTSPDLLLSYTFYMTNDTVSFDRDADTVILVGGTSPGVGIPPQRLFLIRSDHLFLNSSFYKRLFSERCIKNIPRTDDHLRLFKITLSSVDPEALFLILRACHNGWVSLPAPTLNVLDLVLRIAKTAHGLEFNIGNADPSSSTASLPQAAREWLLVRRNGLVANNLLDRWKLVKAAFYFSQRAAFRRLSVALTKRLPDAFWAHLAGDIRRGINMHFEHLLTSEEKTIIDEMEAFPFPAIRLLFIFYNILHREAPFPPNMAPLLPVSALPATITQSWSVHTKAMWDAQVQESSVCTCPWLPQCYNFWTRGLELHMDLFAEGFTGHESHESHRMLFRSISWALGRDVVDKAWDTCKAGEEPECNLANGREGHEKKARELVEKLRRCLCAWMVDLERDPVEDEDSVEDSDEDSDEDSNLERSGVPYSRDSYYDVEVPDAQYPDPVPGGLDKIIVLWTANTERYADLIDGVNNTADNHLKSIEAGHEEVSPSTIFAVACILEGTPFINGSSQNTFVPGRRPSRQLPHQVRQSPHLVLLSISRPFTAGPD
ncbi:hypothetical protein N0V85_004370 [Neurospora sp. IMI 360204]|nr:hypothetical protein N0V85_004370 [Neurospora sp. IMI 360204]